MVLQPWILVSWKLAFTLKLNGKFFPGYTWRRKCQCSVMSSESFCHVEVLFRFYFDREFSKMIKNAGSGIRSICIQIVSLLLPTLGLKSPNYTDPLILQPYIDGKLKNLSCRLLMKSHNASHICSVRLSIRCCWFVWSFSKLVFGVGGMERMSIYPDYLLL